MLGVSGLLWVPVANTIGRRPVILLGTLLLTIFSIWAAVAKSYDSLLAARLFMGIAGGPGETGK
jgi:predicted MFS family arabinose efflux permease